MFVALGIEQVMSMRRSVICGLLDSTIVNCGAIVICVVLRIVCVDCFVLCTVCV